MSATAPTRRHLLALIGGLAALDSRSVAGGGESLKRIGVLMGLADDAEGRARLGAFIDALKERGWESGKTAYFDVRWLSGERGTGAQHARALADTADVILAANAIAVDLLIEARCAKPIVFISIVDHRQRPRGAATSPVSKLTGLMTFEPELARHWANYLREAMPDARPLTLMFNPDTASYAQEAYARVFAPATKALGATPRAARVRSVADIERAFASIDAEDGGLAIMTDPFMTVNARLLVDLATRHGVPTIYPWSFFVKMGGLMSYGPDRIEIFARAAGYVDRVLRGADPRELPVEGPSKPQLVINVKTAFSMRLRLPPALMIRAHMLIPGD
ncbi:MAG TPA: ABC transporter substrate-binding protein [Beijerinckiaceae bacterium]|nr:ABC transporter substrate-binding protein [Beijerinckiaceae bacterium]